VGQQLAGEGEAERFPAADGGRRQGVGLVREPEPVPGIVVGQWGPFLACLAVAAGEGGSRRKSRSRATVRRDTSNSFIKSLLFAR